MLTHEEYKDKKVWWNTDIDWFFGYQCTDLVRHYYSTVYWHSLPSGMWNAIDWWSRLWQLSDDFNKVENVFWDPSNYPSQWDIVFFSTTTSNPYWHVAIVDNSNWYSLRVLEQNWGAGIGSWEWTDAIRLRDYWFHSVLWWYQFKSTWANADWLLLERAKALWFWNWEDWWAYATREEVVLIAMRILDYINWDE